MGIIFAFILIGYLALCDVAGFFSKAELLSIRYNYYWGIYCGDIDAMFPDMELYE